MDLRQHRSNSFEFSARDAISPPEKLTEPDLSSVISLVYFEPRVTRPGSVSSCSKQN
jgi:hypothetical protein